MYFSKQKKIKNLVSIIIPRHINRVNEINESAAKFGFSNVDQFGFSAITPITNVDLRYCFYLIINPQPTHFVIQDLLQKSTIWMIWWLYIQIVDL